MITIKTYILENQILKIKLELNKINRTFIKKHNILLRYQYHIFTLLKIEKKLKEQNTLPEMLKSISLTKINLDENIKILEKEKRTIEKVSRTITYTTFYQNFEEFIHSFLICFFSRIPVFLNKESNQISIEIELVFSKQNIEEFRTELIEKKVKEIIQSNSIYKLIKKIEKIFGIDFEFTSENIRNLITFSQNRNILIHNSGIINSIYLNELNRYNIKTDYNLGYNLIDSIEFELEKMQNEIETIVKKLSEKLIEKTEQIIIYSKTLNNYTPI